MRGVTLRRYPDESFPKNIDFFDLKDFPIPTNLKENDLLIKVCYVSIDPVMRVWFSGAKTYIDTVHQGQVIPAFGCGVVAESKSKRFNKGDLVLGALDCADYCVRNANTIFKLPAVKSKHDPNLPLFLSVYGVTGITALKGLHQIPKENLPTKESKKTLVVSSAAGSTGSFALQIGKYWGYRTVGIVSSRDKKDFVLSLGADACVCYNDTLDSNGIVDTNKLTKLMKQAAPEGIDAMYDNSGEEVLDAVLPAMNKGAFIVLCGATATYYTWKNRGGLKNLSHFITKQIKAEGILYFGQKNAIMESFKEMNELVTGNHIQHKEEFINGLENVTIGLQKVFMGKNLGRVIVKLDNEVPLPKF
ncbi:unnamed protein product (macronuclear) [Paramecium tetraurelia]|uniref:Enoyl reductase (ER) domain-containing protein n=1 Tax=Paramecium tetraurelia TaxID=5888 RepID=A0DNE0_PARTE|nr:uncharacterized protein GSPATT00018753001 [Paramecium tetraurelia]CAK84557.1 unnamed protein product [Paramecium tetraurelia]|eukprot:XP_001451954.1 hypothetical protein (macronuclear) [Paramecium tetraurelia strain d4-2]